MERRRHMARYFSPFLKSMKMIEHMWRIIVKCTSIKGAKRGCTAREIVIRDSFFATLLGIFGYALHAHYGTAVGLLFFLLFAYPILFLLPLNIKREVGPDALSEGILAGYIAVICAGAALIMLLAHLLPEVRLYIPLILSLFIIFLIYGTFNFFEVILKRWLH